MRAYYLEQINNPVDCCDYEFNFFILPENAKIFIKTIGGTDDTIKYNYNDGTITIVTPVWVKNPHKISIGYIK